MPINAHKAIRVGICPVVVSNFDVFTKTETPQGKLAKDRSRAICRPRAGNDRCQRVPLENPQNLQVGDTL